MDQDDRPRKLPKKFRASADPADEQGFALLKLNDEAQREIGTAVNSPFIRATPLQNQMGKALVTIDAYSKSDNHNDSSIEVLAEAYATVGHYDLAATLSSDYKPLYRKYYSAVWKGKPCEHGPEKQTMREYIYSLKENMEMPLLECTVCHNWHVADAPQHLTDIENQQRAVAGVTRGMTIDQARDWHHGTLKRR